jgi:hypothetical protein
MDGSPGKRRSDACDNERQAKASKPMAAEQAPERGELHLANLVKAEMQSGLRPPPRLERN